MKDLEVKKSELIIKARYKLSPLAIKFISVVIGNLKRSDDINEEYVIKVRDFAELTGQKTKRIYELIDEALNDLLKNPITIPLGDDKNSILKANWVSGAVYNAGEIRFMIYPKLRPFLIDVKEKYLKYKLENILPLKSSYVIRLYEILKDWRELNNRYGKKTEKIIELKELREILEIPISYKYGNSSGIKQRILEKARQEFAEQHTDIIFNYEEIKTGRKVTHLKFTIQSNPKKEVKEVEDRYFKSRKSFVALLRKNYSGNFKMFGYKIIENNQYWLGLDKKGLVYANPINLNKGLKNKNFNAIESAKLYDLWLKIAKGSALYQDLVVNGEDLREIEKYHKDLWQGLVADIEYLKDNGII